MAESLQGRVESLLPGGEALVRTKQGVVLAANGVPGDQVVLEDCGRRRGSRRGRISTLIEASDMRVQAGCAVAGECCGCAMQYVDRAAQLEIKSEWVRTAFAASMQHDTQWIPVSGLPSTGMRRRAMWHRGEDDGGAFLGFHSRSSHRVVRTPACPVVIPQMDVLRLRLQAHVPPEIASLRITSLANGMHVVFEVAEGVQQLADDALAACLAVLEEATRNTAPIQLIQPWLRAGVSLRPLTRPAHRLYDSLPAGDAWIDLLVGPDDFVQGHTAGNEAIIRQIQAWAGNPRRISDLFCGIGNLSLPLAVHSGAALAGAELVESSVRQAQLNAKILRLDAEFEVLNLFNKVSLQHYAGADVLLLDPPRQGAKAVCRMMGSLLPEMIIMVNCDIAAGARDAALLAAQGYRMQALRALDIFPFSGHVEAMSCWRR
ncbi:MAG: 23S rRNA methyltransferase [Mariprofundaceae bacterium]|nr:23S rRNA methyltransferase [Mariprofundaceae bacterium]